MAFLRHICNVIRYMQLSASQRRLTFYSEGKNYWPHLEGIISELLNTSNVTVCYVSSGKDDPGLAKVEKNFMSFEIDEGFVRNWFFENIETDIMVMTMPDLHQFQVKRSKHKVHYVYVQHSLVSLHMAYRKGAFDYYDTVFCAGPHHVNEIRVMEEKYSLPKKNIVEHGYGRLDAIIAEAKHRPVKKIKANMPIHILLAPSWGPKAIIESGIGLMLVDQLIEQGHKVTLRPHPQTTKFSLIKVDEIIDKYRSNPLFGFENNVAGQNSLHNSDLMISDWSGAAIDYAFGLKKPVLFIETERKINNTSYQELGVEPFEVSIRHVIGKVVSFEDIKGIDLMDISLGDLAENYYYKNSSSIGSKALIDILEGIN